MTATTPPTGCPSVRLPVGLNEDCGQYSSTGYCGVNNSACVDTGWAWLCKCNRGYVEMYSECFEVPEYFFEDVYIFNLTSDFSGDRIGLIPLLNADVVNGSINWTFSDHDTIRIENNKSEVILIKKDNSVMLLSTRVVIFAKIAMSDIIVNEMFEVYVNITSNASQVIETVILDGTRNNSIIAAIPNLLMAAYMRPPDLYGTFSHLFRLSKEGNIFTKQDINLTSMTNELTYSCVTKLQVIYHQTIEGSFVFDIHVVITRDVYEISVAEDSPQNQMLGTFHFESDNFDNYTFTYPPSSNLHLDFNSSSGEILTGNILPDYENPNERQTSFYIKIQLREVSYQTYVKVRVLDANDNTPQFKDSNKDPVFQVLSGMPSDSLIGVVRATDQDTVGKLIYTIDSNLFTITTEGAIVSTSALTLSSFESDNTNLTVTASDGNHSSTTTATIALITLSPNITNIGHDFQVNITENNHQKSNYTINVQNYTNYKLISPEAKAHFTLNSTTGELTPLTSFDRERLPNGFNNGELKTEVLGVLQGEDRCNVTILGTLRITILDQNDNRPCVSFKGSVNCSGFYTVLNGTILEESPNGEPVKFDDTIGIWDLDHDSQLNISIVNSSSYPYEARLLPHNRLEIVIDKNTRNSELLDREQNPEYQIKLKINDGHGSEWKTSYLYVYITLIDVNDNPPYFTQSRYNFSVEERKAIGFTVGQVRALDVDLNAEISYDVFHSSFDVTESGEITTLVEIDRELVPTYNLTIIASDTTFSTPVNVIIDVLDVNDNDPKFNQSEYMFRIDENKRGFLGNVKAEDKDFGQNGTIRYNISSELFEILQNGTIMCIHTLDYEDSKQHKIEVNASDNGVPPRGGKSNVLVLVENLNDNAPNFVKGNKNITITRRALQVEGRIVTYFEVTDADFGKYGEVKLSVNGNVSNEFKINNNGIVTKLKTEPPHAGVYTGTVIATDYGSPSKSSTASLVIRVINDEKNNTVQFTNTSYEFHVEEEHRYNSSIGKVQLKMPIRDVIFSMIEVSSTIKNRFIINNKTGDLYCNFVPDREEIDSFRFFVKAVSFKDNGGDDLTSVTVKVTDINDRKPEFVNRRVQFEVREDVERGTEMSTFDDGDSWATDDDLGENGTVAFKIQNNMLEIGNHFAINESSGRIIVNFELDVETRATYQLIVKAEDKGIPVLSAERNLEILVTDVNDNPPVFEHGSVEDGDICYIIPINENKSTNKVVFTFTVNDSDVTLINRYTRIEISENCPLIVKEFSDHHMQFEKPLELKEVLDYETKRKHICNITAINTEAQHLSSTCKLRIQVLDGNDNHPVIVSHPPINITNGSEGDIIATINATDEDSNENGKLSFSITTGPYSDFFNVDHERGSISIGKNLAFLDVSQVKLTIQVTDHGQPPLSNRTTLIINILDNNSQPWFPGPGVECNTDAHTHRYTHSIVEADGPLHTARNIHRDLIEITACDRVHKIRVKCNCTYRLVNKTDTFKIHSKTGMITQVKEVDREQNSTFLLEVEAIDNGTFKNGTSKKKTVPNAVLRVTVEDLDDNGPTFPSMEFNVPNSLRPGECVANISVTDPDSSPNATYDYNLDCPPFQDCMFNINNDLECVTANEPLTPYTNDTFTRLITATGKGGRKHKESRNAYFRIYYDDPNKHYPRFEKELYAITLNRTFGKYQKIGKVIALDEDDDKEGEIIYSIISDNPYDMFKIHNDTGLLTLNDDVNNLVPPKVSNITLKLRATDQGDIPKYGDCSMILNLTEWTNQCKVTAPCEDSYKVALVAVIAVSVVLILSMVIAFLVVLNRMKPAPKQRTEFSLHTKMDSETGKTVYDDLKRGEGYVNPILRERTVYTNLLYTPKPPSENKYRQSQEPPVDY